MRLEGIKNPRLQLIWMYHREKIDSLVESIESEQKDLRLLEWAAAVQPGDEAYIARPRTFGGTTFARVTVAEVRPATTPSGLRFGYESSTGMVFDDAFAFVPPEMVPHHV